jgi:CD109 antigen
MINFSNFSINFIFNSDSPAVTTNQKLSKFLPTVLVLKYLKTIGKLSPNKKAEGLRNLETSYQFIISKKLSGKDAGAYKEWDDEVSSIETTALVAKFLNSAKEWIEVDDQNIVQALAFLKGKQASDGKFVNSQMSQEASDDKVGNDVSLSAFTVIAFLENKHYIDRHKQVINKALNFISGKINNIDDNHTLAIAAYALALGKHEAAATFLEKLKSKAVHDGEKTFWDQSGTSSKIETAAYAILAFVEMGKAMTAKNILNWLLSQRSQTGGFSTHIDTVIGLQAVTEMARNLHSSEFNMNVYFLYEPDQVMGVFIDNYSAFELKSITIPTREGVSVQANGTGVAYVQVWQKYIKQNVENSSNKFTVKVKPTMISENLMKLNVCLKFNGQSESAQTIAEISLPSGYEFNGKSTDALKMNGVKVSLKKSCLLLN